MASKRNNEKRRALNLALESLSKRKKSNSDNTLSIKPNKATPLSGVFVAARSDAFDTGGTDGVGYVDESGKVSLTVMLHKEELLCGNEGHRLLNKCGCLVHDSRSCRPVEYDIGSPLFALGKHRDTLELISGTVYREIGSVVIDEGTELREANFCSHRCFAIDVPDNASSICRIGDIKACAPRELSVCERGIVTASDYKRLYIYLGENKTLEDARGELLGKRLIYILNTPREESTSSGLSSEACEEIRYIEVCSSSDIVSHIIYKKTEKQNVRKNQ